MRTEEEVRRHLRFSRLILSGPDMPEKPDDALRGEIAALEWMLHEREDPPNMTDSIMDLLEMVRRYPMTGRAKP